MFFRERFSGPGPGVAVARATLRVAISILTDQFSAARPLENHFRRHPAPPNSLGPRASEILRELRLGRPGPY